MNYEATSSAIIIIELLRLKNVHSFSKLKHANRKTEVLALAKSVTAAFLPKSINLPIELLLQERLQRKQVHAEVHHEHVLSVFLQVPLALNLSINKINSVQKKKHFHFTKMSDMCCGC